MVLWMAPFLSASFKANLSSSCFSSFHPGSFLRPICCASLEFVSMDCRLILPGPSTPTTNLLGVWIRLSNLMALGITMRPLRSILAIFIGSPQSYRSMFLAAHKCLCRIYTRTV